jgi:hypothetical protein
LNRTHPLTRLTPCLVLLLAAAFLPACASQSDAARHLTVAIGVTSADRPAQYFEITPSGELLASAPAAGGLAEIKSVGVLKLPQRQQLLDIVNKYQLMQAPGDAALSSGAGATYQVTIHTAAGTHRLTAVDDHVAGVPELYDAVAAFHAALLNPAPVAK